MRMSSEPRTLVKEDSRSRHRGKEGTKAPKFSRGRQAAPQAPRHRGIEESRFRRIDWDRSQKLAVEVA